jgi:hypothetical protein
LRKLARERRPAVDYLRVLRTGADKTATHGVADPANMQRIRDTHIGS